MANLQNFFTDVLVAILAGSPDNDSAQPPRGLTIDDLDGVRYAGKDERTDLRIHREKIRRLKQSTFTVLNTEELRKVVMAVGLTSTERIRLVAAIAATKIQEELSSRIGPHRAYLAAERLYSLIFEGMQELEASEDFGSVFKFGEQTLMKDLTDFDRAFQGALNAIDRGLLALGSVPYIQDQYEKRSIAQLAYDAFTLALTNLNAQPQTNDSWIYWHHEAEFGQQMAQRYLES